MQLDRLTVALRPRSDWEAVDLGLRLAQRYAGPAYAIWFMASLPWFVVLAYAFHRLEVPTGYLLLVLWWAKPMFERPLLHVFSRVVFGDVPARGEWPGIALRQPYSAGFLAALTWRRFEASRSFNLAVRQLERLKGAARRQRLQVLHLNTGATALSLTLLSLALVVLGAFTLFSLSVSIIEQLFVVLDPMEAEALIDQFFNRLVDSELDWETILAAMYWLCEGLVAPFYVGAGFTLYLNRRTHLEAWDIELSFRQMRARRGGAGVAAVMATVLLGLCATSPAPQAQEVVDNLADERAERRSQIEQILDDDDFGDTVTEVQWVPKNADEEEAASDPERFDFGGLQWLADLVAVIGEVVVWVAVALVVVAIIRWRHLWLPFFQPGRRRTRASGSAPGGLLLTEEELPDDIPAQVRTLWDAGRFRDALSLLYRGALTVLNDRYDLALTASDTEGDCERIVRQRLDADPAGYFATIALAWQRLAYGHDRPATEQVAALCAQWPVIEGGTDE